MTERLRRVLVANRGEVAVRIIRACRELGIETVAVYSTADEGAAHVRLADDSICIGPSASRQSYLNVESILSAALATKADAVHPGYGFLSEQAAFAEECEAHDIAFIGPQTDVMRRMQDKALARRFAHECGVPILPGSREATTDPVGLARSASEVGYPVLLKAAMGGGGRGICRVNDDTQLRDELLRTVAEARTSFGDGRLYVEAMLPECRHVEVQILGDGRTAVHLGERECSVQRRHQKLIEESPSARLSDSLRERICAAGLRIATGLKYKSAGTIEFLVDPSGDRFYFIEMNTRLQVEHTVTEAVTGIDIVQEQLRIASGECLDLRQDDIAVRGHAVECRINAEDPNDAFAPSPGVIDALRFPLGPGVRIDTHCEAGSTIPPYYDSLVAKVIAWGSDRRAAIRRMERALHEFAISGVTTNVPLHRSILCNPRFLDGAMDTKWLEQNLQELLLTVA